MGTDNLPSSTDFPPCRLAPLPDTAAIIVTGTDAASFLDDQLSRDLPAADSSEAPLAGWHTANGRIQGLFRVVRAENAWLLLTHRSAASEIAAALRRFVLRSKVDISAADGEYASALLLGRCDAALTGSGLRVDSRAGTWARAGGIYFIALGAGCVQLVGAAAALRELGGGIAAAPAETAELAQIRLGLPELRSELKGQFIPQMLNLDLLGGIAYDKGCYPGQEIIARTKNLGTVKRRMLRFSGSRDGPAPEVGAALLDPRGESVGTVVRCAPAEGGFEILAVTRLDAADKPLRCAGRAEALLRRETLPYSTAER
jgi:hypothetical protein